MRRRPLTRRNKILLSLGIVAVVLLGVRAALPYTLERLVNRTLAGLEGYGGQVEDVDLALWRGGYAVDDIQIVRTTADHETPFFDCDRIEFTIEWKSLLDGSIVAEGTFWRPQLNLVQAKTKEESQMGTETDWPTRLAELYPFDVNTMRIIDGTVTFRAPGIQSEDALSAHHINAVLTNLTNVAGSGEETFAKFDIKGQVLGEAPMHVSGSVDPLAADPTFDVNMALEGVELPDLNPWLQRFIKADARSGDFQLYMEIAAADGKFEGYAKPLMQNVDVLGAEDQDEGALRKLWEGIVEFASNIVDNDDADEQVAARIPFRGTIKNPETNIIATIGSVMRNAFVSAFARSLEGSISLRDVKQNLSELDEDEAAAEERKKKKT